jgi:hypothetical protein
MNMGNWLGGTLNRPAAQGQGHNFGSPAVNTFLDLLHRTYEESAVPPECTDHDEDPVAWWFASGGIHPGIVGKAIHGLQRLQSAVLRYPKCCIAVAVLAIDLNTLAASLTSPSNVRNNLVNHAAHTAPGNATYAALANAVHYAPDAATCSVLGRSAWQHTTALLRLIVVVVVLWAHEHSPGSLITRPVGTTSAVQEVLQVGKHMTHLCMNLMLPGTLMLLAVDVTVAEEPLVTRKAVASAAAVTPWLLPLIAARCSYAVTRYSRCLGAWCASSVMGSVVIALLSSAVMRRAAMVAKTPGEALQELVTYAREELTLLDVAIICIAVATAATCAKSMLQHRRATAASLTDVKNGLHDMFVHHPRLTASAAVMVLVSVIAGSPPQQAATIVATVTVVYVIVELHTSGKLVDVLVTAAATVAKLIFLFVTVVIPTIIIKLPQLTPAYFKELINAYKLTMGTASFFDLIFMTVQSIPGMLHAVSETVATVAPFVTPAASQANAMIGGYAPVGLIAN